MYLQQTKKVAIIIAHPDDEILWVGGTILNNKNWNCFILCLCRKYDSDRAPRFFNSLTILNATGTICDIDDEPQQKPLNLKEIENTILKHLPTKTYDLIITHSPFGEYTRHLRHEEIGKSIINLWISNKINSLYLRFFAYQDGDKTYYPIAIKDASIYYSLPIDIWQKKYALITTTYNFNIKNWEALTTPKEEAFWHFSSKSELIYWLKTYKTT